MRAREGMLWILLAISLAWGFRGKWAGLFGSGAVPAAKVADAPKVDVHPLGETRSACYLIRSAGEGSGGVWQR